MTKVATIEEFQAIILNWYKHDGRCLPWRNTDDPYHIMIAELLLQKTDVGKARMVYERFVDSWPTIQLLHEGDFCAIADAIEPLGLKYRTARLKSIANTIVTRFGGRIPDTTDMLLQLPGIGRYTASAIECFAYNRRTAILDTNVIRILDRVLGISSQKQRPRNDAYLWDLAQELLPHENVKEYNRALLDFGSVICRNKRPGCDVCSLQGMCTSYRTGHISI